MVEAEEIETLSAPGEVDDTGLLRMQLQPELGQHRTGQCARLLGAFPGRAQDHEIVAVPHQHPEPVPVALPASSKTCKAILASNGEIGEPYEQRWIMRSVRRFDVGRRGVRGRTLRITPGGL